jgi:hypothetical protein
MNNAISTAASTPIKLEIIFKMRALSVEFQDAGHANDIATPNDNSMTIRDTENIVIFRSLRLCNPRQGFISVLASKLSKYIIRFYPVAVHVHSELVQVNKPQNREQGTY